jgi:hypothetical protein
MTDQTDSHEAQFYPFHALNEFMRADYRLIVVRSALNALPTLPDHFRKPIDRITKQVVKVPGFRDATKAPATVKVLPIAKAFEKTPDLVAAILAAWAEGHAELRQQVYDLLKTRGWKMFPAEFSLENLKPDAVMEWAVLPLSVDRTRLPGFISLWPQDNDFEDIYKHFVELYPEVNEGIDNVSLMVVWLSLRLPMDVEGAEEEEAESAEEKPSDQ